MKQGSRVDARKGHLMREKGGEYGIHAVTRACRRSRPLLGLQAAWMDSLDSLHADAMLLSPAASHRLLATSRPCAPACQPCPALQHITPHYWVLVVLKWRPSLATPKAGLASCLPA